MNEFKEEKNFRGITLIALVVTIVVLLILAGISINAVLGNNGLISKAKEAKELQANSVAREEQDMNTLLEECLNALAEQSVPPLDPETLNKGPNGAPLATEVTSTNHDTIIAEDDLGNQVVVPGGFKIAEDSGKTVKEGIVIQDDDLNQFVWVPVSNINHNGNNKIKIDETNEVEITLGRYTFDIGTLDSTTELYNGTGEVSTTEGEYQYAEDYISTITLQSYYQELTTKIEGKNEVAQNLRNFVDSVEKNHGYYIARYEASYASGSRFGVGNDSTYYKPASKISTTATADWQGTLSEATVGYLWNCITQENSSKACRQMYYGNEFVESDLVNSYAWDTAIVFIQAMGNDRYACSNYTTIGNKSLKNTGETGDEVCKIFDMASNLHEWTTEYNSNYSNMHDSFTFTYRGGESEGEWGCAGSRGALNGSATFIRLQTYYIC